MGLTVISIRKKTPGLTPATVQVGTRLGGRVGRVPLGCAEEVKNDPCKITAQEGSRGEPRSSNEEEGKIRRSCRAGVWGNFSLRHRGTRSSNTAESLEGGKRKEQASQFCFPSLISLKLL